MTRKAIKQYIVFFADDEIGTRFSVEYEAVSKIFLKQGIDGERYSEADMVLGFFNTAVTQPTKFQAVTTYAESGERAIEHAEAFIGNRLDFPETTDYIVYDSRELTA